MILNKYGSIVDFVWNRLYKRFSIEIDEFVIMPNHFHRIINIIGEKFGANKVGAIHELPRLNRPKRDLDDITVRRKMIRPKVIGYFKMNTANQINKNRNTSGTSVWQRNYFERIIRDENELNRMRLYIQNNPGKWQEDKYFNRMA